MNNYENVFPKFYGVKDIASILEVSDSKAYSIIRTLNKKMGEEGYITIAGKINSDYFWKCMYISQERKAGAH